MLFFSLVGLTKFKMTQNETTPSKKGRPTKLTDPTVKELLLDIKERGGIKLLRLETLCKDKPDAYGDRASNYPLLRAIQNKVADFKSRPDYYEREQLRLLGEIFDSYLASPPPKTSHKTEDPFVEAFGNLNIMNNYFGNISYDESVDVDASSAWKNRDFFILKTPAVEVGQNPTVSTDVYSIMINGVDSRFFTDVDENVGELYKAIQISHNEIVVEIPAGGFDFLFGDEEAFVFSLNDQEQREYIVMRNKIRKLGPSHYTSKICLRFPKGVRLDYQIIDNQQRQGGIELDFMGQDASLAIKWRIAVVPDNANDRVVRETVANPNATRNKFRRHVGM